MWNRGFVSASSLVLAAAVLWSSSALAERVSDIRNTKHNFSSTVTPNILGNGDTRTVKSQNESEICVFCHTPHGSNPVGGPLWNREIPASSSYTTYTTSSIDSTIGQPNGVSRLCLSCHDGSIAIGSVRNSSGSGGFQAGAIAMQGTAGGGVMASGEGTGSGYTRNLGKDLRNDHPISLTYNSAFVNEDREMRQPGTGPLKVRGVGGFRGGIQNIHLQAENPANPSVETGQVQCISCHDPHIRDTTNDNIKFLRFNRLQKAAPTGLGNFNANNDIICLACHTKAGWASSAHAQPAVANETYTNEAADVREFPRNTQVWESACLACHDTHTVTGSRRLLRAGTDAGTFSSSSGYNIKVGGGEPAVEETCYACHSPNRGTLIGQNRGPGDPFEVPDTFTDFQQATHMPIESNEQGLAGAGISTEMHDIGTVNTPGAGADFLEDPTLLGQSGNLQNRHAECTDCHNPHRVTKRRVFYEDNSGGGHDNEGTHDHITLTDGTGGTAHSNIASGVLRGAWGVEPNYGTNESFHISPGGFTVKKGDPGGSTNTSTGASYVTREYQVCFKCHSNYAFGPDYPDPPLLGASTPSGTNGMTRYTNIAREYNSPDLHKGEDQQPPRGVNGGAWYGVGNHRAWHPVVNNTGRTAGVRHAAAQNWLNPFQRVGNQTMYCTDCHGTLTNRNTVVPGNNKNDINGKPWGPHGSANPFILKGLWRGDRDIGTGEADVTDTTNHLCFNCHAFQQYAGTGTNNSGYAAANCGGMCMGGGMMMTGLNNLHTFHVSQVTRFRCNLCHVAVPHGWKNKNFLVNLNDVGPESTNFPGSPRGTERRRNTTAGYTDGPYYNRAALKVVQFGVSGAWQPTYCGSANRGGNGEVGVPWMTGMGMGGGGGGASEACQNVP